MKKGADDGMALAKEADALANLGNYRAALVKSKFALAASQTNGDDVNTVDVHMLMISCHAGLLEVSRRSRGGLPSKS